MLPNGRVKAAAICQVGHESIMMLLGKFGWNAKFKGLFWTHSWANHTKLAGKKNVQLGRFAASITDIRSRLFIHPHANPTQHLDEQTPPSIRLGGIQGNGVKHSISNHPSYGTIQKRPNPAHGLITQEFLFALLLFCFYLDSEILAIWSYMLFIYGGLIGELTKFSRN